MPTGAQSIRGRRGPPLNYRAQKFTWAPDRPVAATKSDPHRRGFGASAGFGGSYESFGGGPKTRSRPYRDVDCRLRT